VVYKICTIYQLKIHQNAFAAQALPGIPLGKLTALPDPLAGLHGASSWRGDGSKGERREERREKGEERKGRVPHFL